MQKEKMICPICKEEARVGYACGDYFITCAVGCPAPMCDHPSEEATVEEWREWEKTTTAINQIIENGRIIRRWRHALMKMEEDVQELRVVSNMELEELIGLFLKGYTLQPPPRVQKLTVKKKNWAGKFIDWILRGGKPEIKLEKLVVFDETHEYITGYQPKDHGTFLNIAVKPTGWATINRPKISTPHPSPGTNR